MLRRACLTTLCQRLRLRLVVAALVMLAPLSADAASWPAWLRSSTPELTDGAFAEAGLRALPDTPGAPAIAAHATPEGHWLFTNRAGDTFTAGTALEMKRAPAALVSGVTDGFAHVRLVLSQDSLFAGASVLKDTPAASAVLVAIGGELLAARLTARNTLQVSLRPGVSVEATDKESFIEALAQLRRPLEPARLRVLAAIPGGPAVLQATPKFDAGQGGAAIDDVDPDHLAEAIGSIPRQTAILTAKLDGAVLSFQAPSGPDRTVQLSALTAAAARADVDLVILDADPPRQPGGRNWLWQRIEVSGLEHATKRATLADFLDQLAGGRSIFVVSLATDGPNRVRLAATPVSAARPLGDGVSGWIKQATQAVTGQVLGPVLGQVTGAVAPGSVHASLVSDARRRELSRRVFPGLPSLATAVYLAAAILGLLGLPVARGWWQRLWPREARADYANARGYVLARLVRAGAFAAVFLPLVAVPATVVRLARIVMGQRSQPVGTR